MRLYPLYCLIFSLVLFSCGTTTKKPPTGFSSADYPYIEKFHEGVRLKTRGQVNEAITAFEQCLLIKQDDDAVYYALSELHLIKNDRAKSAEYIEKAANLDPKNIWYVQELAYMYFEQGKFDIAADHFEKLVEHEPRNVEWLYGYAESLVKAGRPAEAVKALTKTEEQVGIHPELTIEKFKLYVQIKQADKGIQEILEARKLFPNDAQLIATLVDYYFQNGEEAKAIQMLEDLVKVSPENGRAHLVLSDVYRQKGQQAKAYEELKKAFASEDVDLDTKMKILINIHETSRKIDPEAVELMEMVVSQYPNDAKSHSIRGDYMLNLQNDEEALKSYRKALEFDKKEFPIWNQVLIMEYQAEKFEELYIDSKLCLEYFPTVSTIYLLNGVAAVQLKKNDEAIEVLQTGIELAGNDLAIQSEMYGQLGEAYFNKGNVTKGVENYEIAVKKDPQSLLIKNNFAYRLALSKHDTEKAMKLIDEVLKNSDNTPHFIDTKGFVLFQQGKYSEALSLFENAYGIQPSDKLIVEHLGDAYSKTNKKDKAVEMWRKAKELGSTNKNLDKKIETKEYYEPVY